MDQVYIIVENHADDYDDYNHFVSKTTRSYHKTREGAEKKIQKLLQDEIMKIPEDMKNNPKVSMQYWIKLDKLLSNNQIEAKIGFSDDPIQRVTKYTIVAKDLED